MGTITFRTDEASDAALKELTSSGVDRSEAIRRALTEAASRQRAQRLMAQAEALANDPEDVAEMRRVQADMAALRAW